MTYFSNYKVNDSQWINFDDGTALHFAIIEKEVRDIRDFGNWGELVILGDTTEPYFLEALRRRQVIDVELHGYVIVAGNKQIRFVN